MALTKDQKTAQVQELTTMLTKAQSVMFSHYIGLTVAEVSDLRKQLRQNGAEMKVMKKTLMKLAFKEAGYPDITPKEMDGAVACIFSFHDPLSGAQTAFKFSKKNNKVTLVGGVYDGKLLSTKESMELAQMPGREQLLGMFVGMLRSPLVKFAGICNAPLSGFARALDQMADKGGFTDTVKEEEKEEIKDTTPESPVVESPEESDASASAEVTS